MSVKVASDVDQIKKVCFIPREDIEKMYCVCQLYFFCPSSIVLGASQEIVLDEMYDIYHQQPLEPFVRCEFSLRFLRTFMAMAREVEEFYTERMPNIVNFEFANKVLSYLKVIAGTFA